MTDAEFKLESGAVIIRFDENGEPDFLISYDTKVRVFVVDERAPNDRVYELKRRASDQEIRDVMRDDPIGSCDDQRHAAIDHKINALIDGAPRLRVIPPPPSQKE